MDLYYRKNKRHRCSTYDGCLDCRWIRREMVKQGVLDHAAQARTWTTWCPTYDQCSDCRNKIWAADRQKMIDDPEGWAKDVAERERIYLAWCDGEIDHLDEKTLVFFWDDLQD